MTHTVEYMKPAIGVQILVLVEKWTIPMTVRDVKSAWGQVRLQVEPVNGEGLQWIEMSRVYGKPSGERAMVTR